MSEATINRITTKLFSCSHNICRNVGRSASFNWLGPYCSRRFFASSDVKPFPATSRCSRTSSVSRACHSCCSTSTVPFSSSIIQNTSYVMYVVRQLKRPPHLLWWSCQRLRRTNHRWHAVRTNGVTMIHWRPRDLLSKSSGFFDEAPRLLPIQFQFTLNQIAVKTAFQ